MFSEDLDAFLDDEEFAVEIVVLDTQEVINGIFDRPFSDALDIQGFAPSLTVKSKDAAQYLKRGYRVEITGESELFSITSIEPDGTGLSRVQLELY